MTLLAGGLALAGACVCASARAHAPLAREIALGADSRVAVRMPGFGWLLRGAAQQPFAYACDALLGVQPAESALAMLYGQDGSLLVGTAAGLRGFDPRGCPLPVEQAAALAARPIAALARAASTGDLYAASSGPDATLFVRAAGSADWQARSALPDDESVSALLVAEGEPARVYASLTGGDGQPRPALLVSEDAGATFARVEQERALTLLRVEPGAPARWWAMGRALDGKRGVEILRAEQPAGPWTSVLRVNFYGGFARDEQGVLWAGDEGGGVFRSDDGGDSFVEVAPQQATACLTAGADGLWACTPGSARQRAVARAPSASAELADVLSFAAIDRMVECAPEHDVATTCAAAWREWTVDVRMAGTPAPTAPADAAAPDASAAGGDARADAGTPVEPAARDSGCSASAARRPARPFALGLVLGLGLVLACAGLLRRRRCAVSSRGSR